MSVFFFTSVMQFSLIFFSFISANNLPPFVTFKNFDFTVLGISCFHLHLFGSGLSLSGSWNKNLQNNTEGARFTVLFLQRDYSIRKRAELLYYSNAHRYSASLYSVFFFVCFATRHEFWWGSLPRVFFISEKRSYN